MKATCPKGSEHKRFLTTVIVTEKWLVDETGEWIETKAAVEAKPEGAVWTCAECSTLAKVIKD